MKRKFSTHWKASKQPRKQRKYKAQAPLHIKHMFVSANLAEDLRKKYNRRSFPLRKGDTIKIMRGTYKGKTGKVETIETKWERASIEKIQGTKKDGTKVNVFFQVSNLQIKELFMEDKKRINAIERNIKKDTKKSSLENTPKKIAKAQQKTEGKGKKDNKESLDTKEKK